MAAIGDIPGYERLAVISAAAGSTVLRARDLRTGRVVALKVLRTYESLEAERQERFERETQRLMSLSHPSVVRVWDVGTSAGAAWIAQELVEGPSLLELARALGGALPLDAVMAVAVQLSGALGALSAAELAHLDVSPQNVLVGPEGVAKLCDFGLGFELGLSQRLAGVELTCQEVDHVAPELIEAELPPDGRADVYGLGATLYTCLAGRAPFSGPDLESRLQAIVQGGATELSLLAPGTPPALSEAVTRMMEPDRDDRPLTQDVGPWLERLVHEQLGLQGSPLQWAAATLAAVVQRARRDTAEDTRSGPMLATLLRLRGAAKTVERCLVPGEQFELGRSSETDVPLPYNSISRRHARILCTKEGLWVEDLGSANGVMINGRRVSEPTLLQPGCLLKLGRLAFEVSLADVLRPPPDTSCRLCGVELDQPTSDPERAVCARCRERAEADRQAGEERLRRTLEALGFLVEASLSHSGAFQRWQVRQAGHTWLCSLLELGQRAASAYAEGSRAALGLSHPAILPVRDVLVTHGSLVIVSHPHAGPTLAARVARGGTLRPSQVVAVGWALADALAHAVGQGVTQALIRPELVLLGDDGQPFLLDLGLSPALLEVHRARAGHAVTTTPCFEAPELEDLRTMSVPALVYALAATLSFALTGNPPAELRGGERYDNLPLTMVGSLPPRLAALLARSTSPDPRERPPTPEHLRDALGTLADEEDLDAVSGSTEDALLEDERTDRSRGGSSSDAGGRVDSSHHGSAERFRTQRIDRDRLV